MLSLQLLPVSFELLGIFDIEVVAGVTVYPTVSFSDGDRGQLAAG